MTATQAKDKALIKGVITHEEYKRNPKMTSEWGMIDWEKKGFSFNFVEIPGGLYLTGDPSQDKRFYCYVDDFKMADAVPCVKDWEPFRKAHPELVKKFPKNFRKAPIRGTELTPETEYLPIIDIDIFEGWQYCNYLTWLQKEEQGLLIGLLPYEMDETDEYIKCNYKIKGGYYLASEWQLEYAARGGGREGLEYAYYNPDVVVLDNEGNERVCDGSLIHPHVVAYNHTDKYTDSKMYPQLTERQCIRPEFGVPRGEIDYQPNVFGIYHLCSNVLTYCSNLYVEGKEYPGSFADKYSFDLPEMYAHFPNIGEWEGF